MARPVKDRYFLHLAEDVASRATCKRRKVGCILVDTYGHILATGYNGVGSGLPHCNEEAPCYEGDFPSGEALEKCEAIHAEQNALLQCGDVMVIDTAYCTDSPCIHCMKLFLNTSVKRIVFARRYDGHYDAILALAEKKGIQLCHVITP